MIYIVTLHKKDNDPIKLAVFENKLDALKFKYAYRINRRKSGERITIKKEFIK